MGVKELWSILTPYGERKPICELRGKRVAIDLAGWVCESLNVVDYVVHPRHHLKNLFFRTCYLIWEQVTPVFVLEGVPPDLKRKVMAKRNELQFRGVRPKHVNAPPATQGAGKSGNNRTRFNHVLKQCENLLISMGIQCVQGPGEAEAYCAFLNKHGLVDGVISQDSDCFAYGALRVYRNFSVSSQGTQAASGGAVDIYDMQHICSSMDFGQHKVIVMALLCGCDYCPDGIGGIGKDSVLKLFKKYRESEILERLRSWRSEKVTYDAMELRVDDKSICSNCGHIGRTLSHSKIGCPSCGTHQGCNGSLWKEQRLVLKAELMMRKKAINNIDFPDEEIISEFLSEPNIVPNLALDWEQPNIVKFIKQIGHQLQWPEIYCFQKFFPILTRWHIQQEKGMPCFVKLKEIVKKRIVKGVSSLEVCWEDTRGCFNGLIPNDQIVEYNLEHPRGIQELYSTIEPLDMLQKRYSDIVAAFFKSKEKPPKKVPHKKYDLKVAASEHQNHHDLDTQGPENLLRIKQTKKKATKHIQRTMHKFLKHKESSPDKLPTLQVAKECSTPINECLISDFESDGEFDMSDIINGIVDNNNTLPTINRHAGYSLHYNQLAEDLSIRLAQLGLNIDNEKSHNPSQVINESNLQLQNQLSTPMQSERTNRSSLDDSFDLLVRGEEVNHLVKTPLERFKRQHRLSEQKQSKPLLLASKLEANVSYFFNQSVDGEDVFEQLMSSSMVDFNQDLVVISDSD